MNHKLLNYITFVFLSLAERNSSYCPARWDEELCWPPTPPGTIAQQKCPEGHLGWDFRRFAHRECWPNGTWFIHPQSNKEWSNYTNCVDQEDLDVSMNASYSIINLR